MLRGRLAPTRPAIGLKTSRPSGTCPCHPARKRAGRRALVRKVDRARPWQARAPTPRSTSRGARQSASDGHGGETSPACEGRPDSLAHRPAEGVSQPDEFGYGPMPTARREETSLRPGAASSWRAEERTPRARQTPAHAQGVPSPPPPFHATAHPHRNGKAAPRAKERNGSDTHAKRMPERCARRSKVPSPIRRARHARNT